MKAAKIHSVFVFAILALMLTACSMEASIESLIENTDNVLSAPGQTHGITSGSGQEKLTNTGNYKVSSSIGVVGATNGTNNSLVYTTSGGYKVYGTIQGAIVSQ